MLLVLNVKGFIRYYEKTVKKSTKEKYLSRGNRC